MIANIIPFGADFMTLFPRWLNIQRGMWLAYILSLPVCPWFILSSAKGFLTFLNGYSIFLGPFLGVLITDYFVIRKGNVYIKDLYEQTGRYWYRFGWHWRPFVAWVIPVAFVVSRLQCVEHGRYLTRGSSSLVLHRHSEISLPGEVPAGASSTSSVGSLSALFRVSFTLDCHLLGTTPRRNAQWSLKLLQQSSTRSSML